MLMTITVTDNVLELARAATLARALAELAKKNPTVASLFSVPGLEYSARFLDPQVAPLTEAEMETVTDAFYDQAGDLSQRDTLELLMEGMNDAELRLEYEQLTEYDDAG
jgi:hypothetical protein